jgi:hypothetical protein
VDPARVTTGDQQADADIAAFYKIRDDMLRKSAAAANQRL